MPKVDDLYIEITSDSKKADKSLNDLVNTLSKVQASLRGFNSSGMSGLTNSVRNLSAAMVGLNNVGAKDYTRLAKGIRKIAELDSANITRAGASLVTLSKGLQQLDSIKVSDNSKQIAELASGISKLGYKSATNAIENIPKLASAMRELMATLSTAPRVSQNLINMTNALGNLARTGASSGRAANSLGKSLNFYSSTTGKATKKSFSLAGAIGKLYATYWLLFRAFGKLGDSINIASDLTEVQNVVDVTFGKYKGMVEDMAKTSITDFGMSELTVKQISSRFQAMGGAMGFAQGEMAKTSIELTKLAADMASFYNVEQKDVAKDLESIFTGETRPMRTYGVDLTQATLKEWALKQGMDANIESMSQMEKTMLRYQYVMANTGAAQGDFLRTQDTWANQVRILKQNLEQLSIVVGRTFINALKPLVKYLNVAVQAITQFAQMVSDALGKIFGWKYEVGSGGITADMDDAADGAGDLSSGLGNAVDNAKKLRQQLHGIDELNVLTTDTAGKGSGGGSGTGTGAGEVSGGSWTQDADSMFKAYESEIDTLYQLGEKISEELSNALGNIKWENVYAKAQSFGVGLASFLNGLITPELFGNIGTTIANALNTVLTAANTFATVFNWTNLGDSLAQSVNDFFDHFDWKLAADTMNNLVDGLKEAIWAFFKNLSWKDIIGGAKDFLGELELDTIAVAIGAFTWMMGRKVLTSSVMKTLLTNKITDLIGTSTIPAKAGSIVLSIVAAAVTAVIGFNVGKWIGEQLFPEDAEYYVEFSWSDFFSKLNAEDAKGAFNEWWKDVKAELKLDALQLTFDDSKATFGDKVIAFGDFAKKIIEKIGKLDGILMSVMFPGTSKIAELKSEFTKNMGQLDIDSKVSIITKAEDLWTSFKNLWGTAKKLDVGLIISNIGEKLKELWDSVTSNWGDNKNLSVGSKAKSTKSTVKSLWSDLKSKWGKNKQLSVGSKPKSVKSTVKSMWSGIKSNWGSKPRDVSVGANAKLAPGARESLQNELNKTPLSVESEVTFKIKDGVRLNWDKGLQKWFYYDKGKLTYLAKGGILKNGKWQDIAQYASGGLPNMGQLFVAREAGPELVGKIGNSTAVVNNDQIVSSVSDGVYRAVMAAMSQNGGSNVNVTFEVQGDPNGIFKVVQKGASDYSSRTGRPAFA